MSKFDLKQRMLREDIRQLTEQLVNSKDHFVIMRLENDIKNIANQIVPEEGETFSVTDFIKKTRENKRMGANKNKDDSIFSSVYQHVEDKGGALY